MDGISGPGQLALMFAVFSVMITTGMAIETADLRRLVHRPRAVAIGLGSQLVLLPALGFLIAAVAPIGGSAVVDGSMVEIGPLFSAGIVLLAATPGGAGSNFIIHAVDGDRALSVSLTAISSIVAFATIPLYSAVAFDLFLHGEFDGVTVPVGQLILNVALLTVIPVAIGMSIRARSREFADRAEIPSKVLAAVVIGFIIIGVVIESWEVISDFFAVLAPAMIALNLGAMGLGLAASRIGRLTRPESLAISVETGVQNSPLAITLALTVIGEPAMAVPAGLFGLTMLVTATLIAAIGRRWASDDDPAPVATPDPTRAA